jgi:hypothetical protein
VARAATRVRAALIVFSRSVKTAKARGGVATGDEGGLEVRELPPGIPQRLLEDRQPHVDQIDMRVYQSHRKSSAFLGSGLNESPVTAV